MNKRDIVICCSFLVSTVIGIMFMQERSGREQIIIDSVIGITARCNDGMYSTSKRDNGTCSGHGGVAEWIIGGSDG